MVSGPAGGSRAFSGSSCAGLPFLSADHDEGSLIYGSEKLFRHLQKEHGFSFLFIAHDLDMVEFLCDRVGVMYHGKLVETGPARAVFENPLHPYTKALIAAIPIPDPRRERARAVPDFANMEFSRKGTLQEVEKDHFVLMEGGDAT